ncbi:DUF1127 domain-containing protein [Reyranella sp.]|uniref:DUF1127 domain-containing protein n=1 Tax=Reyranella sp. TaxID=1929291 RepID=UPI0040373FA6
MANISLHHPSQASLAGTFASFGQVLATWRERARQRRELVNLDYRTMRDLGISPTDVQFEANKPFWRS